MTPWTIASAQNLSVACPRILDLPGLAGTDALQAWSVWNRLHDLGPRPRVLEVGHGPWSGILAAMTRTLGGEYWSVGTDQADTDLLRQRLAHTDWGTGVHLGTVPMAKTELDGRHSHFPDLALLGSDMTFGLLWISTSKAVPDPNYLDHVLPALSPYLSLGGFDVVLEAPDPIAASRAIACWTVMTDAAFTMTPGGLHGTGLVVSGRPDTPAPRNSTTSASVLSSISIPRTIRRPELTLPEQEAREVARHYGAAGTILEYGSGGSTVLAAELPGKTVFSVESDPKWLCRLNTYLQATPHPSMPIMYYADIGATGDWGRPTGSEGRANYPDYSAGIWQQDFFRQPDVVLIDGRFRPACFLICAALTQAPVTVLFDDYVERPHYHYIEAVARPVRVAGRMAIFHLVPGDFTDAHRGLLEKALYEPE